MNLLLDTHILVWLFSDPRRVPQATREALADRANTVFVSSASTWEIAIKHARGKLPLPLPPDILIPKGIAASSFAMLPIEVRHTLAAGNLPNHHRDPFDRMLVAQAILENMRLVTNDTKIAAYDVPLLF